MKFLRFLMIFVLLMTVTFSALGEKQIITLTCTGDFLPGSNDRIKNEDFAFQRYIEKYGYGYPFEKLQNLFANDDITLVNLECVLNDDAAESKSRFAFRGPTDYANIFPACSIEVANLANNHYSDFGKAAHQSTIKALESVGVKYCSSTEYGDYGCYVEVKGVRIGFVGVLPLYHKDHAKKVEKVCRDLQAEGCQVIVASLHCGTEYNTTHGNIHDSYAKKLKNYGVNIIVGNHPHVPQGIHVFDGITQIYSLGNASFGGNTGVDEELRVIQGTIAQFALHFEDGQYVGHQLTLWPIHISGVSPENNYQPVLVEGEEAQVVMKKIQKDTDFKLKPYVDGQGAVQDFVPWKGK
ncbi:MAG: CapA family protein [Clostridiales bacterium]|nr:CapA family protein [Clostridiales bacterium]